MPDDAALPQLRALADDGARLAHRLPGAQVRARGQRRHHRRIPAPDTTIRTAVMRFADEDAAGAAYAELTEWMDNGLVLVGDAIMLVSLMSPGQVWNWSYDPDDTDLPLNPMFRMLPEAAANLAGQSD
jgi:hypothetical protein